MKRAVLEDEAELLARCFFASASTLRDRKPLACARDPKGSATVPLPRIVGYTAIPMEV